MTERLPVPVQTIPAETRLAVVLFDIDSISQRAEHERAVKDYSIKAIREALTYKPTLAIDIERALTKSGQLLWEKGHRPQTREENKPKGKTLDQAIAEQMKTYDFRSPVAGKARERVVRSTLRQIARIVHPDSNDDMASRVAATAFPEEQRTRALARASEVSRTNDPQSAEEAQRLLLEIMPRYYLQMVKTLMGGGQSMAEVVTKYPQVVAEMENLRWIAAVRLPLRDSFRRFKTFEDADREAARLKRKPEHHARTIACAMVAGVYGEVMAFGTDKGLSAEALREFKEIQDFMQSAFGYVGGTGEFVVQQGDRLITTRARNLAISLDGSIRALPDKVFSLTEASTAGDVDLDALKQALQGVRYAVTGVSMIARDYGRELEDEANGRDRYSSGFGNLFGGKSGLLKKSYKQESNENIIHQEIFKKYF